MNIYRRLHFAVILFVLVVAIGCKKPKSDPAPATSTYHISWTYQSVSGVPPGNYQFAFTTDAPAGSTVLWNFGDGSVNTMMAPTHVFTTTGSYVITLVVNADTAHMVSKTLDVYQSLPHAIYYSATWMKDSAVHFSSNVPRDSTFAWDFGDGTTSADSTPAHAFAAVGTYTVKLTVNGNVATAATTTVQVVNTPPYTALMGGTRLWHDTSYLGHTGYVDAYPQPDESFAIGIISPLQILFKGTTLTYAPLFSSDSLLFFMSSDIDSGGYSYHIHGYYYRYSDSVKVFKYPQTASHSHVTQYTKWVSP
jgi:PKD repeat protein